MAVSDDFNFDNIDAPVVSGLEDPQKANEAAAEALTASVGDAPSVPDAPEGYVELPVGINVDGESIVSAEVRELTGADEEALARVRNRTRAYIDRILELGTERLGSRPATQEGLRKLYVGDRDQLLIAIRRAMFGDEMEFGGVRCPTCRVRIDVTINLKDMPVRAAPENLREEIELRTKRALVRFPAGNEQAELLDAAEKDSTTNAELNTLLLSRVVEEFIKPDGSRIRASADAVRNLGVKDRGTILKHLNDHVPGPQMADLTITHDDCGQEVPVPVTAGDLFREI